MVVGAKLAADPSSTVKIDGKADDWDLSEAITDPRHDALDSDWSRDITEIASEYTEDSLYVMIKTSDPPSIENWSFYVNIDVSDDNRQEFQFGSSIQNRHVIFWSPPDSKDSSSNTSEAQLGVDDVVEIRVPWKALHVT